MNTTAIVNDNATHNRPTRTVADGATDTVSEQSLATRNNEGQDNVEQKERVRSRGSKHQGGRGNKML